MMEFGGIVLAGGSSLRMGQDKAFLTHKGESLLSRQIKLLQRAGLEQIWISGKTGVSYANFHRPVVIDSQPGQGPLAGIVEAFGKMNCAYLLALAVDMPCMTDGYLLSMIRLARESGKGVVPKGDGGYEPTAAIYAQSSYVDARRFLHQQQLSMKKFVEHEIAAERMIAKNIELAEQRLFLNWNSPQDMQIHP